MTQDGQERIEIITPRHRYFGKRDSSLAFFLGGRETLYLCDSCLHFFSSPDHLQQHLARCSNAFWIPGDEIYRDDVRSFCVFEIDGRKPQCAVFARRLCLLTKLFLVDKVTLDDVHFFCFNALFDVDDEGFHFSGYFSKEWRIGSDNINTLSCVMVLPPSRSKGYGGFLVRLSYEIARTEGMVGTPERPLSRSGNVLFRKVWKDEVLYAVFGLSEQGVPVTVNELSHRSGLIIEDVLVALHDLDVLFSVGRQGPLLVVDTEAREKCMRHRLDSEKLLWTPA